MGGISSSDSEWYRFVESLRKDEQDFLDGEWAGHRMQWEGSEHFQQWMMHGPGRTALERFRRNRNFKIRSK
jgi:hypothetical protein